MQGVQAHPQKFWFVQNFGKTPENLGKASENLGKIPENLGLNSWKSGQKWSPTFAEEHN